MTVEWLAGFFDGEGCIAYYQSPNGFCLDVSVCNNHLPTILAIQKAFGGNLRSQPQGSRNPKWKTTYFLRWGHRKEVEQLLTSLLPHLITKQEQAAFMLNDILPQVGQGRVSSTGLEVRVGLVKKLHEMKQGFSGS